MSTIVRINGSGYADSCYQTYPTNNERTILRSHTTPHLDAQVKTCATIERRSGHIHKCGFRDELTDTAYSPTFGSPTLHSPGRRTSPQLPPTHKHERDIHQELVSLQTMSSRLVSTLPMRTVTRTVAIASTRCSEPPRVKHVNHNTTNFVTLDDSIKESSVQVLSSPTLALAKSLSH